MLTANRILIAGGLLAALFAILFAALIVDRARHDPDLAYLEAEPGADWIRLPRPTNLFNKDPRDVVHAFRCRFNVSEVPRKGIVTFRAMRQVSVFLDGQLIYLSDAKSENWKTEHRIDLSPVLTVGTHELYMKVLNTRGPPALWVCSRDLHIHTGEGWEASRFEKDWIPASSVDRINPSELSRRFKRADAALLDNYLLFTPLFCLSAFLTWLYESRNRPGWMNHITPAASQAKWLLQGVWIVLALNNISKLPLNVGMDIDQHLEYIRYVGRFWRIASPLEGVRMFEAPLYYFVSALMYKPLMLIFPENTVLKALRIVPLVCGSIQIELCYRALKYVFAERQDLQIIGTLLGGLLPMNLYMSQVVGTEPLAGVLIGTATVLMLRVIRYPRQRTREMVVLIGFVWGLALLTKITAVLLLPPLILFLTASSLLGHKESGKGAVAGTGSVLLTLGIALLVSGWYYARNWMETGKVFMGGWDAARGFVLLQDPGYRTLQQLMRFGESLYYPIYAGVMGFWDSLYSTFWLDGFLGGTGRFTSIPPWNYDLMLACAWLSLLPAAAILLGVVKTLRHPLEGLERGTLFAVALLAMYLVAMVYLFLTVPIYSTAKATYTMGLIPCYAVLGAAGMDVLRRGVLLKAITNGLLSAWAFGVYFSYWVF